MAKAGAQEPKTKLAMIAIVFILVGFGWSIYQFNPGGMLRSKTELEVKEEKENKAEEERKAREEERAKPRR